MTSAEERDGPIDPGVDGDASTMERRHVRGSVLLLIGRLCSLVFTVLTQIIIVRALSKADFGVFAYAFALAASFRVLLSLGQGRLLSRFMTTYEEKHDYGRMFGSMLLAVGTIVVTSTLLVVSLAFFHGPLLGRSFDDPRAVDVLLILVFLAPLEALDQVFVSLFAVFSEASAIFFRKYVVTPALRLVVVAFIAFTHGSVYLLALGYVLTSVLGNLIYLVLLLRVLRERDLSRHLRRTQHHRALPRGALLLVPDDDQRARVPGDQPGQRRDPRRLLGSQAGRRLPRGHSRRADEPGRLPDLHHDVPPDDVAAARPRRPRRRARDLLAHLARPRDLDVPHLRDDDGLRPDHHGDPVR